MRNFFLIFMMILNINIFASEMSIKTEDGFVLKGWLTFPKTTKKSYPIVVLAHEFGSSHKMWEPISSMLRNRGYATFEMDLRGHGKSIMQNGKENKIIDDIRAEHLSKSIKMSAKKVNFKNIPNDLGLWIEKLSDNEKINMDDLVIFGSSLGGGAVIPLFIEFEPKLVVLFSPGSGKMFDEEAVDDSISNSDAKILIFSSRGDFALERSFSYAKKALTPTFITLPGSGHGSATFDLALPFLKVYLDKYL